ncbi:uncharacterized protein Eint_111315 [Encephalitozoon intestinalis ATCC 50506]|uniref:Transmembrane protein n=1 Tax=Encephalitozoon intestinalis (strain ATCC 50506) TaxID=876142 RepID=W8P967_ENCIT|nr:uncharacterized protein Eint_111315 [Encephalitozoon intestinalis ATCC 50506]AHL30173.1 hypothetical protein Eint_111315 [Encephalitozoon intestinalis ATCC 50506]UTX46490.1 hypothetical protein GPK93_11g21010 [Encephalitozoon intestinalis]
MSDSCCKIRKEDYEKYVDETPLVAYTSLALVMVVLSIFSIPSLFIYSFIPMFMAMATRSQNQDRVLLSILGCMMGFMTPTLLRKQ